MDFKKAWQQVVRAHSWVGLHVDLIGSAYWAAIALFMGQATGNWPLCLVLFGWTSWTHYRAHRWKFRAMAVMNDAHMMSHMLDDILTGKAKAGLIAVKDIKTPEELAEFLSKLKADEQPKRG